MKKIELYKNKYHKINLSKFNFLITGGAGFIGSNIVDYLLINNAGHVRVLDNLSNGSMQNLNKYFTHPNFEFIHGDIRDITTCIDAIKDIHFISHQAALGSVPRSIEDPITTNQVNINGSLNILNAAKDSKSLIRLVYAASSSTYGDSSQLPKIEGFEGKTLSPYAITKAVNEMYGSVYSKIYNFHTVGLRYFNVFGPNQSSENAYAAVIPKFCKSAIHKYPIEINGDGSTSRDFTFIENVVQANIKALESNLSQSEIYNVACGESTTLLEVVDYLSKISNQKIEILYKKERIGDVKHSLASIEKIKKDLSYFPNIKFKEGIEIAFNWYLNNQYV